MQDGYALGCEGKGSNTSFAGFLTDSVKLGPNVGDRIDVSFDFRGWSQADNPRSIPVIGQMRFGLYQDTDNQFGKSADKGLAGASVLWGADTGENDGDWKESTPGPIGDKGFYMSVPIGLAADPLNSRIHFENNINRYLEGTDVSLGAADGGDICVVANPNDASQGPGGAIFKLFESHTIKMSIVRRSKTLHLLAYFDGMVIDNISIQSIPAR